MYIRPHHRASDIFIWIYVLCTTSNYAIIKAKSAPQNAVLSRAAQGSQTQGFQNHIPARGRKPQFVQQGFTPSQFQNHIPARGRKQVPAVMFSSQQLFQNHIPARGRKLKLKPYSNCFKIRKFQNHIPARGRKQTFVSSIKTSNSIISKPHPRKGTETRLLGEGLMRS